MGCRIHPRLLHLLDHLTGDRVHPRDPFDLVSPVLDPDDRLLVGGEDLEGVTPHPERAAGEVDLVALVLDADKSRDRVRERELDTPHESQELALVLLRRAEAVDR